MPSKDTFGFGSKPCMKEVPLGAEAIFSFRGKPELVETDYGEKYSFPITLISHPSYPLLEEGDTMKMDWQSKCQSAKQLFNGLNDKSYSLHKQLVDHYADSFWVLTRFDTGAYWLEIDRKVVE
jgi:hypothetical protein